MGEEDTLKINTAAIKGGFNKTLGFIKQKKVINIIVIVLFLTLLIGSSWMRLQNLPLLKDSTTGEYIPLALDPFYFLRVAETIVREGGLPGVDVMRQPYEIYEIPFTNEILPRAVVFLFNVAKVFDKDVTLQFIDVIYPVVFFGFGLIVFFFLIYSLTRSKGIALISSAFLAFIPPYIHRTLAGFADHEAIGMFAFFLTLFAYSSALRFLDKDEHIRKLKLKTILFGLLVGFLSVFTIVSWGGMAIFVFMIIPLAFGLFWLIKVQNLEDINKKQLQTFLLFYFVWFISSILFGLIYGFSLQTMLNRVTLSSTSLISGAVLLFTLIDFSLINFKNKISFIKKEKLDKYRVFYSFLIVIFLGILFLGFQGNFFSYISDIFNRFLHPFGGGRVGLTVAENRQPFLNELIQQMGRIFFWIFYLGTIIVGINISKGINKKKNKILFSLVWIAMVSGILFSRISPNSLFDGTNFISRVVYFGGLVLFLVYSAWLYFNDRVKINSGLLLISSWLFFTLIAGRGAIRLFFTITPFVAFMGGYALVNLFNYAKKSRDELLKMFLWILFIIALIGVLFSFNNFVTISSIQAKTTGLSANIQWQNAMSWVRETTPEDSIFLHWWDYGYWVQYLGERPTLSDGGHFEGGFRDHVVGRYVLTTPNPETALSFMKTNNVSYLLIDPTDLGKYPAYSKIGSGPAGTDRFSQIPIMMMDPGQVQETADTKTIFYQGGTSVDQDIIYDSDEGQIFLPSGRAGIGGITLEVKEDKNQVIFNQPKGIFVYNNQRYAIPLRYLYYRGEIFDFEQGLEATARIMPRLSQNAQGVQIERLGSLIYLSPKTMNSLFAQLYLMDDVFERYETVRLAHSESDPIMAILKSQGLEIEEPVYFQGFRGPIKIWEVDYPDNILEKEEFLRREGKYAEFDDLEFLN